MINIIERDRSIIPACDINLEIFEEIVKETADIPGVGGYKVGVSFLDVGLKEVADIAREYTDKPVIYDHQKAGTDIPDTADRFMDSIMRSGINAIILFPQAGPITEYEWIKSAQDRNLGVIVGGEMTHPRYLDGDFKNTTKKNYTEIFKELGIDEDITGYVRNFAPEEMYGLAAKMKVTDFVVPGNKPDYIKYYKNVIEMNGISKSILYSPGLIKQGGKISEGAKAAGKRFHGIVGRGIYEAENIRQAAIDLTSKL